MDAVAGSYALIFVCHESREVSVGRLGKLSISPGYYVYVGSAFGPGGVRARTEHHRRISKRPHWHLDYMRPHLQLLEIWSTYDGERREHQWATELSRLRGAKQPFPGFGASDCGCPTHFLQYGYKPSFAAFRRRIRRQIPEHRRVLFHREA